MKVKETPLKYCEYCGKKLERKRLAHRLEAVSTFLTRKYCDQSCMGKAIYPGVKDKLHVYVETPPPADTDSEQWLPLPEYLGYFVSNCGRVWSTRTRPARILKPFLSEFGYHNVHLADGSFWVHQLVLMTFVGPKPQGMETRHLDGNPLNNHVTNLAWGTRQENADDRTLHGTQLRGELNPSAKLSTTQVKQIRLLYEGGQTMRNLGRQFGVSRHQIWLIVRRLAWKEVS